MARQAVIQLVVDSKGAIKAVGATNAEFKDLKEGVVKLEAELENLDKSVQAGLISPSKSAQKEARLLEKHLQSMIAKGVDPASAGFQRYKKVLDQMQAEQVTATRGMGGMASGTNRANLAMMDLSRIVEDSAFGIRGMANNINPAIQSFTRLRAETGSTRAAIGAMTGSIMGPAGIMFAIGALSSLAIVLGPKLKEAFSQGSEAAEKLKEAAQEAFDAIVSFELGLPGVTVTPENIDTLIQATRNAQIGLRDLMRFQGGDPSFGVIEALQQIERETGEMVIAGSQRARELAQDLIVAEEERLAKLEAQKKVFEDQAATQREMLRRGATIDEKGGTEGSGFARLVDFPSPRLVEGGMLQGEGIFSRKKFPGTGAPPGVKETEDAMDKLFSKLVQIQRLSEIGIITPQERGKAEIQALRQGIEAMIAEGIDPSNEAFQHFLELLDQAEAKSTNWADSLASSFQNVQQVAQQGFQVLGALFNSMHQQRMNQIESERSAAMESIDARLENERLSQAQRTSLLEQRGRLEEQFRKKQREAQQSQARRQKVLSVFEIAMNTASAIVEALPNIPLSVIVGALGAAQAGIVAATPVPEFARGTTNFRGGLAMVGERGRELVALPQGSNVITNENTERLLSSSDNREIVMAIERQTEILESVERYVEVRDVDEKLTRFRGERSRT